MALGNPHKRKSVFPSSRRGKSMSPPLKRGKFANSEAKKGKSLSVESKKKKKKKKKKQTPSASFKKKNVNFQEIRACSMFTKLIDSGAVLDQEPVFYRRKKDNLVMKEGRLTRNGVLCCCCNNLFLLAKFEVHAGSGLHRPSANMYVQDGRSLVDLQRVADIRQSCPGTATFTKTYSRSILEDGNDNICQICGDGGVLMLCDSCPSAFHYDCLHLDAVPNGEQWHCTRCRCGSCGLGKDTESSQDGASMLSCVHCQIPYHQSCVSELHDTVETPWFCSKTCQDIFEKLRRVVGCVFPLKRGLSWILLRAPEEKNELAVEVANSEKLLSEALKVLQQCFDPIVDHETRVNVLSQVVFNRTSNVKRLDCSGFYTMLLLKGEQLVSVATIRTHGKSLAEMPFVGTVFEFRQQGMCKALMQALETMLREVGVCKLIIPSINEVVETWTTSYGFRTMSSQDRKQVSGTNFLSFPGTTPLSKRLIGPELRKRTEPASNGGAEVHGGRPAIQTKDKVAPSNRGLSKFQAISCH